MGVFVSKANDPTHGVATLAAKVGQITYFFNGTDVARTQR
jgi:hypothetical protein